MYLLNIASLLTEHADENAADMISLYQDHAIDATAFSFTLVPEGNPPFDKASECVRRFKIYQKLLKGSGLPTGILLQATMGHGWAPSDRAPWQTLERLDHNPQYTFCPLDPDFQNYVRDAVTKCAQASPDFLMLDDDTRLVAGRNACFCPRHVKLFNETNGTCFTADELREAVVSCPETARQFRQMQRQTMEDYARLIREAIDAVNPKLHCSFCLCFGDVADAPGIARILAGKAGKPVVRINNGVYLNDSARQFPHWMYRTAEEILSFPEDFTILSEPDTCPQNRYSTAASRMRAHLYLSTILGCDGGKLWITRLSFHEPSSGLAYRKVLREESKRLRFLTGNRISWKSPAIPIPAELPPHFPASPNVMAWCIPFARMGIPFSFNKGEDNFHLLTGYQAQVLSEGQLKHILAGKVLLDGTAATALTQRGFASLIGCQAKEWDLDSNPNLEYSENMVAATAKEPGLAHLTLLPGAVELTGLYHEGYHFAGVKTYLAPASLEFRNTLGGHIFTLACPCVQPAGFNGFTFFNETRKRQFLQYLNKLAPLSIYYPEDAEISVLYGTLDDGSRVAVLFNIGMDVLPAVPLKGTWLQSAHPQVLNTEAAWEDVPFTSQNDTLTLQLPMLPQQVLVLKF